MTPHVQQAQGASLILPCACALPIARTHSTRPTRGSQLALEARMVCASRMLLSYTVSFFWAAFVNMAEQPSSSQGTPAPAGKPLPPSLGLCRRLVAGDVAKRPACGSLVRLGRLPSPEPGGSKASSIACCAAVPLAQGANTLIVYLSFLSREAAAAPRHPAHIGSLWW